MSDRPVVRSSDRPVVRQCIEGDNIVVTVDGIERRYRNSCPHIGVPLDWGDGNCLTEDGLLICAMHGALFQPEDGMCIAGPCAGKHLTAVTTGRSDDRTSIDDRTTGRASTTGRPDDRTIGPGAMP